MPVGGHQLVPQREYSAIGAAFLGGLGGTLLGAAIGDGKKREAWRAVPIAKVVSTVRFAPGRHGSMVSVTLQF